MNQGNRKNMDSGFFTLSLDLELIWGTLDLYGPERFRRACEIERNEVIERLLDLLAEFDISATWCTVGHLFLDGCSARDGIKHPEIIRPNHNWHPDDWFAHDPGGDEHQHPEFFGRSILEKIRSCPVPQEIGSHSFSHVIFGDNGCSRETAVSEIAASVKAAREMGIELRSFVFPRNSAGHLDVLREFGFTSYRGEEPNWYEIPAWPKSLKRLAHLFDVLIAAEPPTVMPQLTGEGLWNIPGSMVYFPIHGLRRFVPVSLRVRRAIKGLNAAARHKRIFHLWFHPTNLADETDLMFGGLREIFSRVSLLREKGQLNVMTMGQLASSGRVFEPVVCGAGEFGWS